ncbi:MAG: hypothetical protein IPG42_00460 [Betaproteobacteria bacterium]|nr:hypothetical protein [Betaproteobacteria bacterium]
MLNQILRHRDVPPQAGIQVERTGKVHLYRVGGSQQDGSVPIGPHACITPEWQLAWAKLFFPEWAGHPCRHAAPGFAACAAPS